MHKCLRCGKDFEKMTEGMFGGCPECGSKLFLYVREGEEEHATELVRRLEKKTETAGKLPLEGAALEGVEPLEEVGGEGELSSEGDKIESLKIVSPGVYELNLDTLLGRRGIIMRLKEDGSYAIHLPSLFEKKEKARRNRHTP